MRDRRQYLHQKFIYTARKVCTLREACRREWAAGSCPSETERSRAVVSGEKVQNTTRDKTTITINTLHIKTYLGPQARHLVLQLSHPVRLRHGGRQVVLGGELLVLEEND